MRPHKTKLSNFMEKARNNHREDIKAQGRAWGELPSIIIELPYRIEHKQWTYFDLLLDHIEPADLRVLTQELTSYIHTQYHKHFERIGSKKYDVNDPTTFNLVRIVMRMGIADNSQIRDALNLLENAVAQHLEQKDKSEPLQTIFKILKQLVIFIQQLTPANQYLQPSFIMSQQNEQELNRQVSSLVLYRTFQQISIGENKEIFNKYRVFYIYLLSLKVIQFKGYIKANNLQELFYLIDDSVRHKQYHEIAASMKCILKLQDMITEQLAGDKEGSRVSAALQVLLIDGLQDAKRHYENKLTCFGKCAQFQFKGSFFEELLVILCECQIETMTNGITMIGWFFQHSDSYIEAVSKTINQKAQIQKQLQKARKQDKNVVYLKQIQFQNYQQLFKNFMRHICAQIRQKTFWMLSNIIGSQKWFHTYGSIFLYEIYKEQILINETNIGVKNQIIVCVLNYMCYINLNRKALEKLLQVQFIRQEKEDEYYQPNYPSNAFAFCLQTIIDTLNQCLNCRDNDSYNFSETSLDFLHRALYALTILLITTKQLQKEDLRRNTLYQLGRTNIASELQSLLMAQIANKKEVENILPLAEEIVKQIEAETQKI